MATGISGSFELSGTGGFSARVYYSETYDPAANTSVLSITKLQIKSSTWYGVTYYLSGTVSVDGTAAVTMNSVQGTHYVRNAALNSYADVGAASGYPAAPWVSGTIAHETDGSKSVAVAVNLKGYTISGDSGNGWGISGSQTVALTAIPRASEIGATDANIGAASMIAVTKKASAYTHSIAYQFGSLSGYITASGGVSSSEVKFSATSVAFTVPTSFYAQIPSAKTGACTLTIKTYSGSTQIGDAKACAFTATAAEASCKPTVSGTIVDSNAATKALTGDETKLVRYMSTAKCTITAEAKNSASISSKTIGGTAVSGTTRSIANVESGSVAFAAKDSRGYENSVTVTAPMVAYVKLTNNAVGARTDPTSGNAKLTIKGDYFNGSFGAESNTLTVKWRLSGGTDTAVTPTISGSTYSATVSLSGLDYQQSYTLEVTVSDKLSSITKIVTIGVGLPVFDWGKDEFNIHVPLTVQGHALVPMYSVTVGEEKTVYDAVEDNWGILLTGPFAVNISRNGYQAVAFGISAGPQYGAYTIIGYGTEAYTRRKLSGGAWSTTT